MVRYLAFLLPLMFTAACARSEFHLENPDRTLVACEMLLEPDSDLQASFSEQIETRESFVRTLGATGTMRMSCEKKERNDIGIGIEIHVNGSRAAAARTNSFDEPATAEIPWK